MEKHDYTGYQDNWSPIEHDEVAPHQHAEQEWRAGTGWSLIGLLGIATGIIWGICLILKAII